MAIYIENISKTRFDFHYRVTVEKAVRLAMNEYGVPESLDINVMIVSPDEIRQINNQTRNIDQVTDVLSFPYFEQETPGVFDIEKTDWADGDIFGDIILCGDRVIAQSREYGHSQKRELAFLTVHSMLHLCGYDHIKPEDAAIMEAEQERMMQLLGIAR